MRLIRCLLRLRDRWRRWPDVWGGPLDPEADWRWQKRWGGAWGLPSDRREDEPFGSER